MNDREAELLNVHLITEIFNLHGRKCSFCVRVVGSVEHYNVQIHANAAHFKDIYCGQSADARYIKSKRSFDIVYTIEENAYKRGDIQLQITDIRPSETPESPK